MTRRTTQKARRATALRSGIRPARTESSIAVQNLTYDVFCSGTAALPDGRSLIVGGTSDYTFTGENRASIFNPGTGRFVQSQNMVDGRWYATATTLGDGRVMAMSGLTQNRRHQHNGRDLRPHERRGWLERTDERSFHSAALPAHSASAERNRVLHGARKWRIQCKRLDFQPHDRDLDSIGCKDARPVLWLVGHAAAAAPQLHSAGHELRRRQPASRNDGHHRSLRGLPELDAGT